MAMPHKISHRAGESLEVDDEEAPPASELVFLETFIVV
jgi:hypothetical protein